MLREVLLLSQVVLLSAALPLALLSAWGYRNAPFGAVLRPMPIIAGAFLLQAGTALLGLPEHAAETVGVVASAVGLVAIVWAAIQLVTLVSGRRRI